MSFTTKQAGRALCLTPNNMRKYRFNHDLGEEMGLGNMVSWALNDLRTIQEIKGDRWNLPTWEIKFRAAQLEGDPIEGTMRIWAEDEETAKAKARAWFWEALLKEEPGRWGVAVGFEVWHAKTFEVKQLPEKEDEDGIITFIND